MADTRLNPNEEPADYQQLQAQANRHHTDKAIQPCAGAVVIDDEGRLLLIQRRNPPNAGSWSIPGGRCEPDETAEDCCVREMLEETGLRVEIVRWVGQVSRPGTGGVSYLIDDFLCRVVGGDLRSASDATAAAWVDAQQLGALLLVPGLEAALGEWGLLPADHRLP